MTYLPLDFARPLSTTAVVSLLPPERSGIAHVTAQLISHPDWRSDVYAPSFSSGLQTNVPILSLDDLERNLNRYSSIVFLVGNHAKWVPVLDLLYRIDTRRNKPKLCLYIHDPYLRGLMGAPALSEYAAGSSTRDLGVRNLFARTSIHAVFVNSKAAQDLIARDFAELPRHAISVLFLPVFTPSAPRTLLRKRTRIGTFGIQGPTKCSETVLGAFRHLRLLGHDLELVMAGYGMASFAASARIVGEPGVMIYDSPDELLLDSLMGSIDLGVQLRAENRGESSGVVARLLAHNRAIIVSDLGSFQELNGAVCQAPPGIEAVALAKLILDELRQSGARSLAVQRYVSDHSPGRFISLFASELTRLEGFLQTRLPADRAG